MEKANYQLRRGDGVGSKQVVQNEKGTEPVPDPSR